jgi:hypothetical protein
MQLSAVICQPVLHQLIFCLRLQFARYDHRKQAQAGTLHSKNMAQIEVPARLTPPAVSAVARVTDHCERVTQARTLHARLLVR